MVMEPESPFYCEKLCLKYVLLEDVEITGNNNF